MKKRLLKVAEETVMANDKDGRVCVCVLGGGRGGEGRGSRTFPFIFFCPVINYAKKRYSGLVANLPM